MMKRVVRALSVGAIVLTSLALAPTAQADCTSYCNAVTANCTGANAQYAGPDPTAVCLATCAHFTPGTPGEMTGATLGCREYWAGEAASNAADACPKAGPAGKTGACGTHCNNFCSLSFSICAGGDTTYVNDAEDDCDDDCLLFYGVNSIDYSADATDTTDSLRCRMHQLTLAATDASQCPAHGGPQAATGNSTVCVDPIQGQGGNGPGPGSGGSTNGSGGGGGNGSGAAGGAANAGGASAATTGAGTLTRPPSEDEGCSCAVPAGGDGRGALAWLAALVPFVVRRKRV